MTAGELIELLKGFPPDSKVQILCDYMQEGCLSIENFPGSHRSTTLLES